MICTSVVQEIVHMPGYAKVDPKDRIGSHIGTVNLVYNDHVFELSF